VTRTAVGDVTFAAGKAAGGSGIGAAEKAAAATTTTKKSKAGAEKMQKPAWCGEYALGMDAFKPGVVRQAASARPCLSAESWGALACTRIVRRRATHSSPPAR
jgi:hypothetical protein